MLSRHRLTSITVLVAALFVSSIPLHGQTNANNWSRLTSLEQGTKLSIKLKSGKSLEGTLDSVSEASISLNVKRAAQDVKREDVQSVHRVTKKSATKATLIGMGVGAGAGAIGGAVGGSDSDFDKIEQAATAGLAVIGAGVGALVGYLIGRSGNKKELIYEAR
jgi:hypothetical protein